MTRERRRRRLLTISLLSAALVLLFVFFICRGSSFISPSEVLSELMHGRQPTTLNAIVFDVRLPRALGCVVVGAMLGIVGSAFQALFRNPLAEPYVVGVSSGAAVGGSIAFVLGLGGAWEGIYSGMGATVCAFACGLLTLLLVFGIVKSRGVIETQTLLLAGVVIGSMLSAVLSLILLWSGHDTNQVLRWLLGSMSTMFYNRIALMAILLLVGGGILLSQARNLNAFATGEESAARLGVNVGRLKPLVLVVGTAMTAVTVGSVGIIGFLGLVAPHISRRLVGVDWRWSLTGSALVGAVLLLAADLAAQHLINGAEINVGIVTAVLGAPFLLVLMRSRNPA